MKEDFTSQTLWLDLLKRSLVLSPIHTNRQYQRWYLGMGLRPIFIASVSLSELYNCKCMISVLSVNDDADAYVRCERILRLSNR